MTNQRQRVALVTGAASGIGRATVALLGQTGFRTIGVDRQAADIVTDLSTEDGCAQMLRRAGELAPDGLDLVVAAAGVSGAPPADTVAINYFGAVATLDGLRPLLAMRDGARAIGICSSALIMPPEEPLLAACLAGERARALELAGTATNHVYATSKRALAQWIRRAAIRPEWGGAGIALNGIAPGTIATPMTADLLSTPEKRAYLNQRNPCPIDYVAGPDEVAELILALGTLRSRYLLGQIIFFDGGTDALLREASF